MKRGKLIWIPRVLAIVFIVFISLFALDAFSGGAPFMEKLGHFLVQLIPSFILAFILLIAWRKPLLGGFLFIFLSIAFALLLESYRSSPAFFGITCPITLAGILFIVFDLADRT